MKTDVLIVGAGPVGLTAAIELARYGIAVRIIDKAPERTDKSKALVVWSRTLELLERSGCSAALVEAGYKVTAVNILADKKQIGRVSFEAVESAYHYALMLPQSETERVLDEFLNRLGIKVQRSVELKQFTASSENVVSTLQHADGSEEIIETSWLIGCDGAHSKVRHQLGMEFHGNTSLINWVLADIHLEGVPRVPEINIVWHSDGLLATFPIQAGRYRVVADVGLATQDEPHPAPPTLEQVQALLDKRLPGAPRATHPVWLSSFTINERKVKEYRAGRVFLAGDAAHVHSPAGGQGMNTGIQDACNLAWKLAMVVRGTGAESLLESYSQERSPIAEEVLKVTGRATSLATLTGDLTQSIRNHVASLILGLAPFRELAANVVSEITVGYPNSPLNGLNQLAKLTPGQRAPLRANEPPVGAGEAPRFILAGKSEGMPRGLFERYANLLEPQLRDPYDSAGLWLIRPDGYIALAVKSNNWDAIDTYLSHISETQRKPDANPDRS